MERTSDTQNDNALWVFGYGSLMWNPGFEHASRQIAVLPDYSRSFCMWSVHYRGTEAAPGLVLALDHDVGSACHGLAFEVPGHRRDETLDYLRERELISSAYVERFLPVDLAEGGHRVEAVTYVIDRAHDQYCANLDLEAQAEYIARACGERGPNRDYLMNTVAHLDALGITDPDLGWLARRVQDISPA